MSLSGFAYFLVVAVYACVGFAVLLAGAVVAMLAPKHETVTYTLRYAGGLHVVIGVTMLCFALMTLLSVLR